MKPFGSNGWSASHRDTIRGFGDWTVEGNPDPRDRSPIDDPTWPFEVGRYPRQPYSMVEDRSDIEPPRSPKKAWSEQPPKSPKDVPETERPRSPKSPERRYGRISEGSGDFC